MGFYGEHVLPHLIRFAMRNPDLSPYRDRVVSRASGRVLEIGIGTGENLPRYGPAVSELIGLEPAPRLAANRPARRRALADRDRDRGRNGGADAG